MSKTSSNEGIVVFFLSNTFCCTKKTLESPLDCKEIKPINSKGNQPWIFIGRTDAEAPILWPPDAKSQFIGKDPDTGKYWRQKEKGTAEDEMVRWHHWVNGLEVEQAPGDGGGQRSLACCSPWGHNVVTEQHKFCSYCVCVPVKSKSPDTLPPASLPLYIFFPLSIILA